jgi:hypothetical protein
MRRSDPGETEAGTLAYDSYAGALGDTAILEFTATDYPDD